MKTILPTEMNLGFTLAVSEEEPTEYRIVKPRPGTNAALITLTDFQMMQLCSAWLVNHNARALSKK